MKKIAVDPSPIPPVRTPRELADLLAAQAPIDAHTLETLRATACAPRLRYPLGSAQADVVAVAAGLKPMLRSTLSLDAARDALSRYRPLGLHGLVIRADDRHGEARLYLGRDRARLAAAARADDARDDRALGHLLGYPRCCVDAFLAVPQPRTASAVLHARFDARSDDAYHRLNCVDLHVFQFVPWYPCDPACGLSRRYADAVAARIPGAAAWLGLRGDVDLARFVQDIDRALSAHRLHVFAGVQLSLTGPVRDGAVEIHSAWPTAADRQPGAPLADDEREALVRLLHRVERSRRVAVSAGTLLLDERPIARAPHLFLARFEPAPDSGLDPAQDRRERAAG